MEPTLCFRLCETPIIYIKDSICRCSGSGIMDYSRQKDSFCKKQCPAPGNRESKTKNTCGGIETYSAYAEEQFYSRHAQLFDYKIHFKSCIFWNTTSYYNTFEVKIDQSSVKSPLTKLDRCGGQCLDQNVTIKSIAFNRNENQCLCIISQNLNVNTDRSLNFKILSNNSCDLYCDNTFNDSNIEHKFKCGSLNDSRIWAIYELIDICPTGFIYIKELKKCMYSYKYRWDSCPSSSRGFIYNKTITWNIFLKIIEKLNLNTSTVMVNFDDDVRIDPSWKCSIRTTTTTRTDSSESSEKYARSTLNRLYLLQDGCLYEYVYSYYSSTSYSRLCSMDPISNDVYSDTYRSYLTYLPVNSEIMYDCPTNWLDLNNHCYRISDERKTIEEARNSCITISEDEQSKKHDEVIAHVSKFDDDDYDYDDDEKNEKQNKIQNYINDLLKGEIVQYTLSWQARLGFFLLDTIVHYSLGNISIFFIYEKTID
ncbi:unnamed protein product [Rotaria sp. Silwood2]|nr:unnamed protein product [Rotaria sp. Silwood2]